GALSDVLGQRLPYDDVDGVRRAIIADAPQFASPGQAPAHPGGDPQIWNAIGTEGALDTEIPMESPIRDFYLTNPIARASETMAECSRIFVSGAAKMAAE